MIRKITDLDRVVRNTVIGVVILGLMFAASLLGSWLVSPTERIVDIRWAEYELPITVGHLDDDGYIVRTVDVDSGLPIASRDGTVSLVAIRCGPVDPVSVVSTRTWLVEQPEDVFLRIEGETISLTIPATDGCVAIERDYQLPQRVEDLVVTVPESRVTVSFLLQPLGGELGAILVESEPFHRWQPDRAVRTETLEIE